MQGLGFVGTAMALATAAARTPDGSPVFDVVGVERGDRAGRARAAALGRWELPIGSVDPKLGEALAAAREAGNLSATTEPSAYEGADVTIVDVALDVEQRAGRPHVDFADLRASVRRIAERMPAGSLLIIETTVPPGTCEMVIGPELDTVLAGRGLAPESIHLAHAYERVMPGAEHLDSVANFWRVYAGRTPEAADACEAFLSQVVNVADYPLTRLASTTASETGKLLENSYRATNIAFMEEWGRFAEAVGVDLFEVIGAIRRRPTHSNMRQPGFGVGGYCLPKDPLFAEYAARDLFGLTGVSFPFSEQAVQVNEAMPLVTLNKLEELLGSLEDRRVLLLGAVYRAGVADSRYSPSKVFVAGARERGAEAVTHDPLIDDWETGELISGPLPSPQGFDAVVLAVGHPDYTTVDVDAWLGDARPVVLDANDVLDRGRLRKLARAGCLVWSIGRGRVSE